jgi:hypothetical protein
MVNKNSFTWGMELILGMVGEIKHHPILSFYNNLIEVKS